MQLQIRVSASDIPNPHSIQYDMSTMSVYREANLEPAQSIGYPFHHGVDEPSDGRLLRVLGADQAGPHPNQGVPVGTCQQRARPGHAAEQHVKSTLEKRRVNPEISLLI